MAGKDPEMTLALFIEQLANGLVSGSIYALMGGGLALIYGTMRVMNFAHGEFYMVGGYVFLLALTALGLHPVLAVALTIATVPMFAMATHQVLIQPLLAKGNWEVTTIVTTLGLSIALQSLALRTVGEEYHSVPYLARGSIDFGLFEMPTQRVLILVAAVVAIVAMELLLRYSRAGWALRATSQDRDAAMVVGISTRSVFLLAFALSGVLAAVSAVFLSPIQSINPWMGLPLSLKAFVVVILGGMGSFRGTILAGFLIGLVEAVGITLTSSAWRDMFAYGLLVVVLWFMPEGLFGERHRRA